MYDNSEKLIYLRITLRTIYNMTAHVNRICFQWNHNFTLQKIILIEPTYIRSIHALKISSLGHGLQKMGLIFGSLSSKMNLVLL